MKRILLYTHELSYTGAPTSLLRICKVLKKNNYYLEVWSKSEGNYEKEFQNIGVTVKIVPDYEIASHIAEIRTFDLAIANTIVSYKFYNECRQYIPTIWYIREAQNIKSLLGQNEYWEGIFRSASRLYCVSDYAAEYIRENYNPNVEVVHNCVEDFYEPTKEEDRNYIKLIMLGSLTARKAFLDVVQAYENLNSEEKSVIRIAFAGREVPSGKVYAQNLFDKAKKDANIIYLGEISEKPEIIAQYKDSDVVVVPSLDESCSLVVLEGAMMAKPIIVSENVGAKYMITEENGWVYETSNVEQLTLILKQVVHNKDKLKIMGQHSRTRYEELANMASYEKNIVAMVERVLQEGINEEEILKNRAIASSLINLRLDKVEGIVKKKETLLSREKQENKEIIKSKDTQIKKLKADNQYLRTHIYSGFINFGSAYDNNILKEIDFIRKSGFFDSQWYRKMYQDSIRYDSPEEHYYFEGWKKGYDPSPFFSSKNYVEDNLKGRMRMCPLVHFEKVGKESFCVVTCSEQINNLLEDENYKIQIVNHSLLFDEDWYREQYNIDVDYDAAEHYYSIGWRLGYNPSPKFSTLNYGYRFSKYMKDRECPLVHFETLGIRMGLDIASEAQWNQELLNVDYADKKIVLGLTANKKSIQKLYKYISLVFTQCEELRNIELVLPITEFKKKEEDLPQNIRKLLSNRVQIIWTKYERFPSVYSEIKKKYSDCDIVIGNTNLDKDYAWVKKLIDLSSEHENAICCYNPIPISLDLSHELIIDNKVSITNSNCIMNHKFGVLYPKSLTMLNDNRNDEWPEEYSLWASAVSQNISIFAFDRNCEKESEVKEVIQNYCFDCFKEKNAELYLTVKEKLFELNNQRNNKKIKLIIPAREKNKEYNGDYHYGLAIMRAFERNGFEVEFRYIDEWYEPFDGKYVFVLRGPIKYECNPWDYNIMWNISHPEDVSLQEYVSYDQVFIASKPWCKKVNHLLKKWKYDLRAKPLLQCTDMELFNAAGLEPKMDVLFVGMCHPEGRKVVNDLLPCDYDFSLYGPRWEKQEAYSYLKGGVVENAILSNYYEMAKVVLNDTRPDMMNRGFVPNRIYDVIASGSVVITEYTPEVEEIFGDCVITYDGTSVDLHQKIDKCLSDEKYRDQIITKGQQFILEHTFDKRVSQICKLLS